MATPLGQELLLIVTGPMRLLLPDPKPIDPADIDKTLEVEPEIQRAITAFVNADKAKPQGDEPVEHDYFGTLAMVSADVPLERSLQVTQLLQPPLGAEYVMKFKPVHAFLRATLPKLAVTTLTGIQKVEPSALELSPFWRAWETIEDPRVLLRDLQEHILVSDQVEVLKQLFPEVYGLMTKAMLAALAERKTKEPDWEPTLQQGQQAETLLQISRLSPELAAELQQLATGAERAQQAEDAAPAGPKRGDLRDKSADAYQTSTQRIGFR
jgi:hypothetical protein